MQFDDFVREVTVTVGITFGLQPARVLNDLLTGLARAVLLATK